MLAAATLLKCSNSPGNGGRIDTWEDVGSIVAGIDLVPGEWHYMFKFSKHTAGGCFVNGFLLRKYLLFNSTCLVQ